MGDAEVLDVGVGEEATDAGAEPITFEEPVEHEDSSEQVITPEPEPSAEPSQEGEFEEIKDEEVVNALKELKRLDPKWTRVIDRIRKDNFEISRYRNAFPTSRAAEMAAKEYQTVGGVEGIADLREKEQWIQWVDEAAEAGDSSIIDDWIKDFPGGFREVAPYALNKFAQMDREGFDKAIAPYVGGILDRSQLADRLSEAFDAIANQNGAGAQSILRNIYAWVQSQKQISQQGSQPQANPADEKLTQRENAVREQEQRAFQSQIAHETVSHRQTQIERALAPSLRGRKISEQAKARLVSTINQDINDNLLRDDGFQRQVKAFLARKDARGTADYIKNHELSIIPSISKRVLQDLYGELPKAAKAGALSGLNGRNGQKTSPSGPVRLTAKPAIGDIQRNPGYMEAFIAGQAIMAKGPYKGRLVRWK